MSKNTGKINLDNYLSVQEYAKLKGITPYYVRKIIAGRTKKSLEAIKIGRVWFVKRKQE